MILDSVLYVAVEMIGQISCQAVERWCLGHERNLTSEGQHAGLLVWNTQTSLPVMCLTGD